MTLYGSALSPCLSVGVLCCLGLCLCHAKRVEQIDPQRANRERELLRPSCRMCNVGQVPELHCLGLLAHDHERMGGWCAEPVPVCSVVGGGGWVMSHSSPPPFPNPTNNRPPHAQWGSQCVLRLHVPVRLEFFGLMCRHSRLFLCLFPVWGLFCS